MLATRLLLASLLVPTAAFSQQLTVVNAKDKELKKSAYRLRITPDRLRQARRALDDATTLVARIEPIPVSQVSQIATWWLRLHRTGAQQRLEQLYGELKRAAAEAADEAAYRQQTQAGQSLLASLSELNPDRAGTLARTWPDPPKRLGESVSKLRSTFEAEFTKQSLRQIGMRNPEQIASRLPEYENPGMLDPIVMSRVALHLSQTGRRDDALRLLDKAIGAMDQTTPDPRSFSDYMNMLSIFPVVDSERAVAAVAALVRVSKNQGTMPGGMTLQTPGGRRVDLTGAEAAVARMLQNNRMLSPEQALRIITSAPELKIKLDSIGGMDVLYGPNSARPIPSPEARAAMGATGNPYAVAPSSLETIQVTPKLRTLAGQDPETLRKQVATDFQPEQFHQLLRTAQQLGHQNDDLATTALEAARALVAKIEPLERRAQLMNFMVRVWAEVDGEVEPGVYREGFVLVDDLRHPAAPASVQAPPVNASALASAADGLEQVLLTEYARDDFDGALKYINGMSDNAAKVRILLEIAQRFLSPF